MIRIREKSPNGPGSIQYVLNFIKNKRQKASDLKKVWDLLEPEINQSVKYEFSEANPNKWEKDSPSWIAEKTSQGYPATTGIYTGALKRAATDEAIKKKTNNTFYWAVNESVVNDFGDSVGDYAGHFAEDRPIFKYTQKFIVGVIKKAIRQWIKEK